MMNNEGVIALMKQALKFYADSENYKGYFNGKDLEPSLIGVDSGHQARFTLKLLDDIEKTEADMEIDYTNFVEPDTNLEDITQIIKNNLNK